MEGSPFRNEDLAVLLSVIIRSWDSSCAITIRGKRRPEKITRNTAVMTVLFFIIIKVLS